MIPLQVTVCLLQFNKILVRSVECQQDIYIVKTYDGLVYISTYMFCQLIKIVAGIRDGLLLQPMMHYL